MINLCIIGSGDVIRDRHAPILKSMAKDIRVISIVSRRQPQVTKIQETLGYAVKRFNSMDNALREGFDAALVAVTPTSTLDVATYLSCLGIPMYVEKPLAAEAISGAKFTEDVIAQELPVVVGENFQYQERFTVAQSMINACGHTKLTHVVIRDILRRGLRDHPRDDDDLFLEYFVQIVSAVRKVTGRSVELISSCEKRNMGSIAEYLIRGVLEMGTLLEIQLNLTNTWSEDRYSLVFDDADIKISHVYGHDTKKYTDTLEHWHGSEEMIEVVTIPNADCGMSKCWSELISMIKHGASKPSPTLMSALNDLQVREAVSLSRAKGVPIPIIKL